LTWLTFSADFSAVLFHDHFRQSQTQASPTFIPFTGLIGPVQAVKHLIEIVF
jgi:hypothetical protein